METNHQPPENLDKCDHSGRADDDDPGLDAQLLLAAREHCRGKDRVVSLRFHLILAELRDEFVPPLLAILRVEYDPTTDLALVAHLLMDVCARLALRDPVDQVVRKRPPQGFEEIDLCAVPDFTRCLPLKLSLHV